MRITANEEDVGHPILIREMQRGRWYRGYTDPDENSPEYVHYYLRTDEDDFVIRVHLEEGGALSVVECDDDIFVVPCPPGFQIILANDPPDAGEDDGDEDLPPKKKYARKGKVLRGR